MSEKKQIGQIRKKLSFLLVMACCALRVMAAGVADAAAPQENTANPMPLPLEVMVGQSLSYDISQHIIDPEGEEMTFEMIAAILVPSMCQDSSCIGWITGLSADGVLTGNVPDESNDEETYLIHFKVTDASGDSATLPFQIWVGDINISVSPSDLSLTTPVDVGSSAESSFTVENSGSLDLVLGTFSITGSGASHFSLTGNSCSEQTIPVSGSCVFNISFSPTSAGLKSATLTIPSNAPDTPQLDISLQGTGEEPTVVTNPDIRVSPASHDFGSVKVETTSAEQTFTISNTGNENLSISAISVTGTDAAAFTLQNDNASGQTIVTSASRSVGVVFSPASEGTKTAALNISSDDPDTPTLTIPLSGIGETDPVFTHYYPHIASDTQWETEICAINTGTSSLTGTFKAYDNAGSLVSEIPDVTLAPRARKEIIVGIEFASPAQIGYVVFEADAGQVVGYTKFYTSGQYRAAVPLVSDVNTGDLHLSHVASDNQWWTGIGLVNTTSAAKTLTFEFDNGETRTVSLGANAHQAVTIKSLFGDEPRPDIHSAVIKNSGGVIGLELFGDTGQLTGILLKESTASTLFYPHVASDADWWTGIVAYNPSESGCDLSITPFDSQGNALTSQQVSVEGKGKYVGTVADLDLPEDTAWFRVEASQPITGFELFGKRAGMQLAGYTGVNIDSKSGAFPKLEKEGWTGIAFVNITNSSAIVTLTAYDDSGTAVAETTLDLQPHEKLVSLAEAMFSQDIGNATYVGYVSDEEVAGFQLNGSSDDTMLDGLPGM